MWNRWTIYGEIKSLIFFLSSQKFRLSINYILWTFIHSIIYWWLCDEKNLSNLIKRDLAPNENPSCNNTYKFRLLSRNFHQKKNFQYLYRRKYNQNYVDNDDYPQNFEWVKDWWKKRKSIFFHVNTHIKHTYIDLIKDQPDQMLMIYLIDKKFMAIMNEWI